MGRALWIIASLAFFTLGCGRSHPPGEIAVSLVTAQEPNHSIIRIAGLSDAELRALRDARLSDEAWVALFRVGVSGNDAAPVAGDYVIQSGSLEFHPRFPFDRGQPYLIRFDPKELPVPRAAPVLQATVSLPATRLEPSTVVTAITPSSDTWPESLLRFYIHFSAPMSRRGAIGFVSLVDEKGRKLKDVFLEVNANLWNGDDTRFTVLLDPGRVKRGILPNLELGRAIRDRGRYSIVVDAAWRDAEGQPLKEAYRRDVKVGLPIEKPLTPADWRVIPPKADTRDPVSVTFPWPLDHALLQHAIGVSSHSGQGVKGAVSTEADETRWVFTPEAPWKRGPHELRVLTLLEDPSGNQVGRAFEMKPGTAADPRREPEIVAIPFVVGHTFAERR
jgi:hypothetical protein